LALTLRLTGARDYSVFEDGQHIGRIRFASERSPGVWLWHVQVHIPGPPFGSAVSLEFRPRMPPLRALFKPDPSRPARQYLRPLKADEGKAPGAEVQAVGRGLGHSHTRPDTARILGSERLSFSPWSAADEAFEGAVPVIRFGMNG
jgi:hypothetical protein